jgi:hypothetical protein
MLPVTGNSVPDIAKASQFLDVDVDQVAWRFTLVTLYWRFGLKISHSPKTKAVEHPGHGGEGSGQQPGDVPEVEALVTELHGTLQVLRIKRPPLGAANTASIHQCSCPT